LTVDETETISNYHTNARGDARYYTETELDAGQLDNRYYTETEVDTWRSSVTQTEMDYLHGISSDIQTQLDARCLESVFGTAIGAGLLLDATTLKASAILQKYHAIDPSANVQSLLGAADYAAMRTLLNFEDGADVTDFTNVNAALAAADAAIDVNGQKITSVTDPTANQDAATKKYADDLAINVDGGFANSTYTASQVIDGGAA